MCNLGNLWLFVKFELTALDRVAAKHGLAVRPASDLNARKATTDSTPGEMEASGQGFPLLSRARHV